MGDVIKMTDALKKHHIRVRAKNRSLTNVMLLAMMLPMYTLIAWQDYFRRSMDD